MSCAITHLALSHFRSHQRMRVDFDGRPVAIYGPNGAGKTNILEAISMLSPGRGLRRAASDEMIRRPEGIGWKVTAHLSSAPLDHQIATSAQEGGARQVEIDGKTAPQMALARLLRLVWLVPAQDRLWIEGADGRRRFLDRIAMNFRPDHGEVTLAYEKAMRERNRLLKDGARDGVWFDALEAQMADAAFAIHHNRLAAIADLMAAQSDAQTAFPAADLDLAVEDMPDRPEDLRAAWAQTRPRDMVAGRTLIGPHRSDLDAIFRTKGVAARQCSTGEQKALLISIILATARALKAQTGQAPIVLLDEVAAHLDAGRRAALFDEICALGAQAFMTGTGPELFVEFGPRAQYLSLTEAGGVSCLSESHP